MNQVLQDLFGNSDQARIRTIKKNVAALFCGQTSLLKELE